MRSYILKIWDSKAVTPFFYDFFVTAVTTDMTVIRIIIVMSKEEMTMNWINENKEILLMVSPLVFVQLLMFAYCAILIKKEGVANLNRPLWLLICFFINIFGPIIFLILGRNGDR